MLSWLDRFWDNVTGNVGAAVAKAVHWAEHALAGVFLTIFGLVGKGWARLQAGFGTAWSAAATYGREVTNWAYWLRRVLIPAIERWAAGELARLGRAITATWAAAVRDLEALGAWARNAVTAVTRWVLAHVWAPLKAFADWLWTRIREWAYTAWWMITHPDQLAELLILHLAAAAERHAWELAGTLGRFAFLLVLRNVRRFALLIEDIVTAVL